MSLVSLAHTHLILQLCFFAGMLCDSRDCRRRASLRLAPVRQAWQVKAREVLGMRAAVAPLRAKAGGKAAKAEPEPEPEMEVRLHYVPYSPPQRGGLWLERSQTTFSELCVSTPPRLLCPDHHLFSCLTCPLVQDEVELWSVALGITKANVKAGTLAADVCEEVKSIITKACPKLPSKKKMKDLDMEDEQVRSCRDLPEFSPWPPGDSPLPHADRSPACAFSPSSRCMSSPTGSPPMSSSQRTASCLQK